ncbi:Bug family tripartite tricarboxylate transporter substrate binding protein [Ottowia thiooxydans]|uniref:Tripartite-type tricarboxylate transporter receptor subunit TctC n=1 Tax=Ottowia thiooxydans TaxID=219182 RepID=A0ABV2QGY6_9BURK
MSRSVLGLLVAGFYAVAVTPAVAAWPEKPVRLIVPFAPGGSASSSARLTANKLSEVLGQQVIVENMGGANGSIGASAALRAPADGYTLFYSSAGIMTVNPSLYPNLSYAVKDFKPISLTSTFASLLYVKHDFPAKTIPELVAYAKANPGKVTYGSAGQGSSGHLWGEVLKAQSQTDVRHIPYKGTSPALTDVMGGQITFLVDAAVTGIQQVKAGKLRALAATSTSRIPVAADVPTFKEQGLSGFETLSWYGIFAPAGTPDAVVKTLQQAAARITSMPDYKEQFQSQGMSAVSSTPEELARQIQEEDSYWKKIIRGANIVIE